MFIQIINVYLSFDRRFSYLFIRLSSGITPALWSYGTSIFDRPKFDLKELKEFILQRLIVFDALSVIMSLFIW